MPWTQHILVPTDFSTGAAQALETALLVGRQNDARITLAHVCETRPPFARPSEGVSDYERALREQLMDQLRSLTEPYLSAAPDLDMSLVNETSPARGILKYARAEGVDLIVLATRGGGGIPPFLIGGVTERVVRHAPCRVLVVPAETRV